MRAARAELPPAGVAAGHPQTADAGAEILRAGGSAADAAVAAALASCVSETVMTGLLGGGHAIYLDAASGEIRNLDCFVAVPGLGAEPREPELVHLEVPFGTELVHYAVAPGRLVRREVLAREQSAALDRQVEEGGADRPAVGASGSLGRNELERTHEALLLEPLAGLEERAAGRVHPRALVHRHHRREHREALGVRAREVRAASRQR